MVFACSRALERLGMRMEIMTETMVMTTKSSMRVKALAGRWDVMFACAGGLDDMMGSIEM